MNQKFIFSKSLLITLGLIFSFFFYGLSLAQSNLPEPNHHWTFDDITNGNQVQDSKSDLTGFLDSNLLTLVPGKTNRAVQFPGEERPIDFNLPSIQRNWTIGAWVRRLRGTLSTNTPLLQYNINETNQGQIQVTIDGSEVPTRNGSPLAFLAPGTYTLEVTSIDQAGNVGAEGVSFTIQASRPSITISSPTPR